MELQLIESKHPNKSAQKIYDNLFGIEQHKKALLETLRFFFQAQRIEKWHATHHSGKLTFLNSVVTGTPVIILAGDVGCGKTALANSIGTPLADELDKRVQVFETPSNIRGGGRVGEISSRITEAFTQAKAKVKGENYGLLIIDEADDLATDREQVQAHHEDKSGLNVLIKQIDSISKDQVNLAVIIITNRLKALDPAVVRRATQVVLFSRPDADARKLVFKSLLSGSETNENDLNELALASEHPIVPYSFSDLVQRLGRQALIKAIENDRPFDKAILLETIAQVQPSPSIQ